MLDLILIIVFIFTYSDLIEVILTPSANFQEVEVGPGASVTVTATEITAAVEFGVIQANCFLQNISISYNQTLTRGSYTSGVNVGLVVFTRGLVSSTSVYVTNPNGSPAQVLLGLQVYDSNGK